MMDLSKYYLAYLVIMSIATFLVFFQDKVNARSGRFRTRERTLYFLSMAGGAFGGLLAMIIFKHKTRKQVFWVVQLAGIALHTLLFLILL
jgi:uncharacterized membrane protein YsdA (DUF1294 family)